MRWVLMTSAMLITGAAHAESEAGQLPAPLPAAEALMSGVAHDWRRAHESVKDQVGDLIFQRNFPLKNEMSPDDMIACIDDIALKAEPTRPVEAMIGECGTPGQDEID